MKIIEATEVDYFSSKLGEYHTVKEGRRNTNPLPNLERRDINELPQSWQ